MENTIIINNAEELRESLIANKNLELGLNICEEYFMYKHHMFELVLRDGNYYYIMKEDNRYYIELFNSSVFFSSQELSTKMSEMVYCYMSSIPNETKAYLMIKTEHEEDVTELLHMNNIPYNLETSAGVLLAQEKVNNYYNIHYGNTTSEYIKNDIYNNINANSELCTNLSDIAYLSLDDNTIEQEVENVKNIFKKL